MSLSGRPTTIRPLGAHSSALMECARYLQERGKGDDGATGSGRGWEEGEKYLRRWKGGLLQNSSKLQSWEGLARPLDQALARQNRCVSLCSQAVGEPVQGSCSAHPFPEHPSDGFTSQVAGPQGEEVLVGMKQTSGQPDTYITHRKLMNWHSGFPCQSPARCVNTSLCSSAGTTLRLKNSSRWVESPDLNLAGGSLNKASGSFKLNIICKDGHINNILFKC